MMVDLISEKAYPVTKRLEMDLEIFLEQEMFTYTEDLSLLIGVGKEKMV